MVQVSNLILIDLSRCKKKLVRNLAGKKFHCHANPLFTSLGLAKVSDLIKINQIVLLKKFQLGFLPNTIKPLFNFKSEAGERLTIGYQDQFATLLSGNYSIGLFPLSEACKSWNLCPPCIKNLPKPKQIKKALNEYYISKYDTIGVNNNCYPCTQSV